MSREERIQSHRARIEGIIAENRNKQAEQAAGANMPGTALQNSGSTTSSSVSAGSFRIDRSGPSNQPNMSVAFANAPFKTVAESLSSGSVKVVPKGNTAESRVSLNARGSSLDDIMDIIIKPKGWTLKRVGDTIEVWDKVPE